MASVVVVYHTPIFGGAILFSIYMAIIVRQQRTMRDRDREHEAAMDAMNRRLVDRLE